MTASAGRVLRWTAVVITLTFGLVTCWHDTAYAHGGVVLTLHSDGLGSVWADVAWEDGHLVGEAISAAISAQSRAGQRVGPVAMAALPRQGSVRYRGTLPAGQWTVTVEAAAPGTGTCSAEFLVASAGKPQSVTCDKQAAAPAVGAAAAAPADEPGSGRTLVFGAVTLAVVIAAGIALLMARDRT